MACGVDFLPAKAVRKNPGGAVFVCGKVTFPLGVLERSSRGGSELADGSVEVEL
jgi:hypothetical protein